ncbi:MAG: acetyl-CoA C-acyltransferase [Chloroflexi bacterium]|nr:acetyl-CoA C-acyltransferase [Chloroflexota bacterium]
MGRFLGALSSLTAPQLGAVAARAALDRAGLKGGELDEVIFGNVVSAGVGQAPARQVALGAGVPVEVPAVTVNKVCGSGLKAMSFAAQAIRAGDADLILAGGMESMSQAPYLLRQARTGYRLGDGQIVDAVVHDGLWCAIEQWHMGMAAEHIAAVFGVSRAEQDEYALGSQQRAAAAVASCRFRAEIVPVDVAQRGSSVRVETDETPRAETTLEALARLKPAFAPGGTVTAGNAPGLSDGAAAVVVASAEAVERYGLQPLARVTGYASASLEPKMLFAAPPRAIQRLLDRTGLRLDDFDLLEINEAFAAQVLANGRELHWDWSRLNVNGGAIALGHPIGATGARLVVSLLHALRSRGGRRGLAALCLGGGGAIAASFELV